MKKNDVLAAKFSLALIISTLGFHHSIGQSIQFQAKGLYSEGLAYHKATDQFIVGSLARNEVGYVSRSGNYEPFISLPKNTSSMGLHVGRNDETLFVALGSILDPSYAYIAVYDLGHGELVNLIDLNESFGNKRRLPNGFSEDKKGNVYVSDSFAGLVYKIDKARNVSIFSDHSMLKISADFNAQGIPNFGPNGITLLNNKLVIGHYEKNEMFVMDLKDPKDIQLLVLSETLPGGIDGLATVSKKELVGVSNYSSSLFSLKSSDGWKTAAVEAKKLPKKSYPSSGVVVDNKFYYLESYLLEFFTPEIEPRTYFTISTEIVD